MPIAEADYTQKGKTGQPKERFIFLVMVILEGLVILFFLSSIIANRKKVVSLKLDLKKVEEEFSNKELGLAKEIESLRAAEKDLSDKLKDAQDSRSELESKLNEARLLSEDLRLELDAAKKEKDTIRRDFSQQLKKTESMLLSKLENANKENADLQNKLFKLTALTQESETPEEPSVQVDLKKIVVKQEGDGYIEGKVIRSEAKYGFIIFNLGSKDKLKLGAVVDIYKAKLKIAQANVSEVYPSMSFATVIKEKSIRPVSTGDKVYFKPSSSAAKNPAQ